MRSYKLIHQLFNLLEQFEAENGVKEGTMNDFAGFLVNNLREPEGELAGSDVRFGKNELRAQELAFMVDNNISRLFFFMGRYAKSYVKKALKDTPLQTAEDFTCLAILLTHDHLSKGELITRNIQEKTSGTEVIRRLLSAGLVKQWDDEEDKRGKKISITDEGKALLYRVFINTSDVGKIVVGKLSITEKLALQHLLQKLDDFHYPIHESRSVNSKADLHTLAESLQLN